MVHSGSRTTDCLLSIAHLLHAHNMQLLRKFFSASFVFSSWFWSHLFSVLHNFWRDKRTSDEEKLWRRRVTEKASSSLKVFSPPPPHAPVFCRNFPDFAPARLNFLIQTTNCWPYINSTLNKGQFMSKSRGCVKQCCGMATYMPMRHS